jgi:RNA polymerase sigma-70 factor, ECF subfamily
VSDPLGNPEEAIRRVYAYVAYWIGAGPEAEDVTSATIERAIRYRSSYRQDDGTPAAWLIGIARRCVSDAVSARGVAATSVEVVEPFGSDHREASAERVDLYRAVAQLDSRARDLVALRYGADLSSRDIARIYQTSPGAVDVALHRALKELRGYLDGSVRRAESEGSRPE